MKILWHELGLRLQYTGPGAAAERQAFGLQAVFGLLRGLPTQAGQHIAFHAVDKPLQRVNQLRPGQTLDITLAFVLPPDAPADRFAEALWTHLRQPAHPWAVTPLGAQIEHVLDLPAPVADPDQETELDFLTVLPLTPRQLPFSAATLLESVTRRFRQVFGADPGLPDRHDRLELLGHLWHHDEVTTFSRSQNPGRNRDDAQAHRPRVIGRRGPLLLRGASARLRQVLQALQPLHLHAHSDLTGWGHYHLHAPARPILDPHIDDTPALRDAVVRTLRLNDGLALMSAGQPTDEEEIVATVHAGLVDGAWPVRPTEAALIPKDGGGARLIERLHPLDLIAQQHLLKILTRHLDRSLSDVATAFRPGRSREDITARVREALRSGYRFAVRTDIEDCFPSIAHDRLFACLDRWLPRADVRMRALLRSFVTAPYELAGTLMPRFRGLAQGSPLSPLLTNLYLDRLDRELLDASFHILRYADDILVLARSRPDADRALRLLTQAAGDIGLQLHPGKTAIRPVAEGFTFLGEHFDDRRLEDPIESLAAQRKPLILTQPYLNLGANGETLEARCDGKLLDAWPLRRLSEVIVLGRSTFSTALLEKCARHGIPVSLALDGGYQVATLAPDSRRFHAIASRHSQWFGSLSDGVRTACAAQIAAAKIGNYLSFMRMRGEPAGSATLTRLNEARAAALGAQDVATIRGHEGQAARATFQWLQTQIDAPQRPHFSAARRERGAPDRLNSMLNFGYYLLYTRLNALLRAHGLNPYLGLLHDGQDDYETLVADLQEPFRCHVDRLVLRMINRRQVRPDGFEQGERPRKGTARYWLARPTLKCYAEEFERMMGEVIGGVVLRDALLAQVRALRRCVMGEGAFWLYTWQERTPRPVPAGGETEQDEARTAADTEAGDLGLSPQEPPDEGSR